jgi:hypothetical protein
VSQVAISCADNRCAANQQVATLCNATHNVLCKSCQANSWSYTGRTELGPCLCNAGYELQGELCVACPKDRQANANNSIMCKVCAVGTFTPVSASITCQSCSHVCSTQPLRVINLARACSAGNCPVTSRTVLYGNIANYGPGLGLMDFLIIFFTQWKDDGIETIQLHMVLMSGLSLICRNQWM